MSSGIRHGTVPGVISPAAVPVSWRLAPRPGRSGRAVSESRRRRRRCQLARARRGRRGYTAPTAPARLRVREPPCRLPPAVHVRRILLPGRGQSVLVGRDAVAHQQQPFVGEVQRDPTGHVPGGGDDVHRGRCRPERGPLHPIAVDIHSRVTVVGVLLEPVLPAIHVRRVLPAVHARRTLHASVDDRVRQFEDVRQSPARSPSWWVSTTSRMSPQPAPPHRGRPRSGRWCCGRRRRPRRDRRRLGPGRAGLAVRARRLGTAPIRGVPNSVLRPTHRRPVDRSR